jgi:hypothetical protein
MSKFKTGMDIYGEVKGSAFYDILKRDTCEAKQKYICKDELVLFLNKWDGISFEEADRLIKDLEESR